MRPIKFIMALCFAGVLAGCASVDTPSRNAPFSAQNAGPFPQTLVNFEAAQNAMIYDVQNISVVVPDSLIVSEANRYYPRGDIVWREDPPGNRHEQVAAIVQDAMKRGTADINGDVPVDLEITVLRFHALTEKTRYTVGGIHSLRFELAIRSAANGLLLEPPREIQADLVGFGGQRAVDAIRQGQTQKVRITAHLAHVIETELSNPSGYENPKLGLIQALNNRF